MRLAALAVLAGAALLAGCAQRLFYHPDRVLYETPARAGLAYEEVKFASRDGTRLVGWFLPAAGGNPKSAKGTVVHFHGNAQNISTHWRFVEWLPRAGYNVFVFDYRGYGGSEGSPTPQGLFEDSQAAIACVRARSDVDALKLVIFGQSLGGSNAVAALGTEKREGIRAVVIEATFASYSQIAGEKLSGAGMLMSDSHSANRFIASLAPIPVLFIHGTEDPVVPFHHSEQLFALAGEPKEFWRIDGGGHLDAFGSRYGDLYRARLLRYLDERVGL